MAEKAYRLSSSSIVSADFSLPRNPQWATSNEATDIGLLFTLFPQPILLFIPSSFSFNYMNYLICICDSCLLDYAELTWTEHSCSMINSVVSVWIFKFLCALVPQGGQCSEYEWQIQDSKIRQTYTCWVLIPSLLCIPEKLAICPYGKLLSNPSFVHHQGHECMSSVLCWVIN